MRRAASAVGWAVGMVLLAACRHAAPVPDAGLTARLGATPGGYLTGEVEGLEDGDVLERRDFVWTLDFSPDASRVAFTHLAGRDYALSLWRLGSPPSRVVDASLNLSEFDVEALAFSADGALLASAGWDGQVRLFDAVTGAPRGSVRTEEPLTAVAFHPGGEYLAVGSARGLVTLLRVADLGFSFEARPHADRVSALAFAADGTLYSGGWDGRIHVLDSRRMPPERQQARVRFERRGGHAVVRGFVDRDTPMDFALDARLPVLVLGSGAAREAGIDTAFTQETVSVPTALGTTLARLVHGRRLRFKGLVLDGVDVAVCDACLPADVTGVLGAPFSERVDVAFDESTQEAVLTLKPPAAGSSSSASPPPPSPPPSTELTLVLHPRATFSLPGHVNDVTVDAAGHRLGVALSVMKAERTRAIYEREKKGLAEPTAEGDIAAVVDAGTGQVLHAWHGHAGVVASAGISPDGHALASGGWDRRLLLWREGQAAPVDERHLGWSVRRVRFSPDGRQVGVAAWTPQKMTGSQQSDPSLALYSVRYAHPGLERRGEAVRESVR